MEKKPQYVQSPLMKLINNHIFVQRSPQALFESEGGNDLTGQIFVYAKSSNGIDQTIAHAVFLPQHAHIFASIGHRDSLLLESHPELCDHLAMCGALIENFLEHQGSHGGVCRE